MAFALPSTAATERNWCAPTGKADMTSEEDVRDLSHLDTADLSPRDIPPGVDRRAFMMRSALIGATAVISGCSRSDPHSSAGFAASAEAAPAPPLSPELEVVKRATGPVMTTIDEFYKVGPGPSSSHC